MFIGIEEGFNDTNKDKDKEQEQDCFSGEDDDIDSAQYTDDNEGGSEDCF